MNDRIELLEAALNLLDEGIAVLDERSQVLLWNDAAAAITGYTAEQLTAHPCPPDLYEIDREHGDIACSSPARGGVPGMAAGKTRVALTPAQLPPDASEEIGPLAQPALVSMRHRLGHRLPAMLRKLPLHTARGGRIGTALLFYPVDAVDALPRGDGMQHAGIERSAANMEDRLDAAHHHWTTSRVPYGLLWITVDQAMHLRKSHGREACEAMLKTVEHTLARQMGPAEIIGRWGDDEFLILAHERTPQLLADHAQRLARCTRTAEFHWWGDRVSLSASIGASHIRPEDTLHTLLLRAQQSMQASIYAGGNHATATA